MNDDSIEESEAIESALRKNNWLAVVEVLQACPSIGNAIFPKNRGQSTLLHVAAERNAPPDFVAELVRLGVFRTVKDAYGRQPHQIAKRNGFEELAWPLQPELAVELDPDCLGLIQEMFHGLLRTFMRAYHTPVQLRLPQLSILLEVQDVRVWFPIPGMAGGCNFWLEKEESEYALHAESWCRICGGSGMHHRITPTEIVLIEEGFV